MLVCVETNLSCKKINKNSKTPTKQPHKFNTARRFSHFQQYENETMLMMNKKKLSTTTNNEQKQKQKQKISLIHKIVLLFSFIHAMIKLWIFGVMWRVVIYNVIPAVILVVKMHNKTLFLFLFLSFSLWIWTHS